MDELYLYIIKGLQHLYIQSRQIDRLDECNDDFVGVFESFYNLTKDKIRMSRKDILSYKTDIIEVKTEGKYYHAERALLFFQVFFKCCAFKVYKRNIISLRPPFDALLSYIKSYTNKTDSDLLSDKNNEFENQYVDDNTSEEERTKAFASISRNIDISNIE